MSNENEEWYSNSYCCDSAKNETTGKWALFFICVALVLYGIVGK